MDGVWQIFARSEPFEPKLKRYDADSRTRSDATTLDYPRQWDQEWDRVSDNVDDYECEEGESTIGAPAAGGVALDDIPELQDEGEPSMLKSSLNS